MSRLWPGADLLTSLASAKLREAVDHLPFIGVDLATGEVITK